MQEMTGTAWKRRGSSVIFDGRLIGEFVGKDAMVSLQEALNWMGNWPAEVPGGGQTVLICGLEAAVEVMEAAEAENFLRDRYRAHFDSPRRRGHAEFLESSECTPGAAGGSGMNWPTGYRHWSLREEPRLRVLSAMWPCACAEAAW